MDEACGRMGMDGGPGIIRAMLNNEILRKSATQRMLISEIGLVTSSRSYGSSRAHRTFAT